MVFGYLGWITWSRVLLFYSCLSLPGWPCLLGVSGLGPLKMMVFYGLDQSDSLLWLLNNNRTQQGCSRTNASRLNYSTARKHIWTHQQSPWDGLYTMSHHALSHRSSAFTTRFGAEGVTRWKPKTSTSSDWTIFPPPSSLWTSPRQLLPWPSEEPEQTSWSKKYSGFLHQAQGSLEMWHRYWGVAVIEEDNNSGP